jgi:hypothetical protein
MVQGDVVVVVVVMEEGVYTYVYACVQKRQGF